MINDIATRGAVFMHHWLNDNIALKRLPEWDKEFLGNITRMCVAEAAVLGITPEELQAGIRCDLDVLIHMAMANSPPEEFDPHGVKRMPSSARH